MCRTALMAALICIFGPLTVPVGPVPLSMATLAVYEGRILASEEQLLKLAENGQILTQYVGLDGKPTMDIAANINGSVFAVEGLLSPDGHVFGKMGHAERIGDGLYQNVPGEYDMKLFESAVAYFKGE